MNPSILKKLLKISTCILFSFQAHASNPIIDTQMVDAPSKFKMRLGTTNQATGIRVYNQDSTINNEEALFPSTSKISIPYLIEDGPQTWEMINMDKTKIKVKDFDTLVPGSKEFFISHVFATAQKTFIMCRKSLEAAATVFPNDLLLKAAIDCWDDSSFGTLKIYPFGLPGERNAYYNREETGSYVNGQKQYERELRFGFFKCGDKYIYTAYSSDVVAHESGHGIIDLLNRILFYSSLNQTMAIHEAVADLIALFYALYQAPLADALTLVTKNDLSSEKNYASQIAEEFGQNVNGSKCLRNLNDVVKMNDIKDEEPHALSQILSGAYHSAFANAYKEAYEKHSATCTDTWLLQTTSFYALTLLNHSIITLPGQNPSFNDFARNILSLSQQYQTSAPSAVAFINPNKLKWTEYLTHEFQIRGIINGNSLVPEGILNRILKRRPCALFHENKTDMPNRVISLTNPEPDFDINASDIANNDVSDNKVRMLEN